LNYLDYNKLSWKKLINIVFQKEVKIGENKARKKYKKKNKNKNKKSNLNRKKRIGV
jgi:hypothetical protein